MIMNNIEKLGFDTWFKNKVDFNFCHCATPDLSGQAMAALEYLTC